jgi:hypothetical protein
VSSDEPPLVSPHWRPLRDAIAHGRQRVDHNDIAHNQLAAAINRGDVRCKIEQLVRRGPYPHPLENVSVVLPPDFFQRDMEAIAIPDGINLRARHDFRRHTFLGLAYELVEPYTVYVWGSHLEKLWPTVVAVTAQKSVLPKPGTADAWIDVVAPNGAWRNSPGKELHRLTAQHIDNLNIENERNAKKQGRKPPPSIKCPGPRAFQIAVAKRHQRERQDQAQ